MITSIFLGAVWIVLEVITSPFRLLSDVSSNSEVSSAITNATHYLANINGFLPVTTILTILGLVVSLELIIATYKIIMWVVRRMPTQS